MNKYLLYLKNPKILLLIFLVIPVIVLSIIAVIKALKPTPLPETKLCPGDTIKTTCPDGSIQCVDKCIDDQHWDCKTGACICTQPGTVLCSNKSVCCSVCSNDMCCTDDMIAKDSDGNKICCAQETTPDPSGVGCVAVCGTGTYKKACSQGEFCNQISGLTAVDLASMKSNAGNNYRGIDDSNNIYFCSEPPTCSWDSDKDRFLPSLTEHGVPYYSSSDIFGSEDDGICALPGSYAPDSGCYGATQEQCKGDCTWTTPLDILSESNGYDKLSRIMDKIAVQKGQSPNGHYCSIGDTGNMQWLQYIQKGAESNCSYVDCNNALIEPGVIRIKWDENTATCSSVKSTKNQGAVKGNVRCNGVNDPCSACTKAGDFVDCVKCYKQGSPCSECAGTEYIPSDSCIRANNDWNFKSCVDGNNRVDLYKSNTGGICGDVNTICGNCPFGDNSTIATYISGDTRKRGEINSNNKTCVSDGQIWTPPPPPVEKRYRIKTAPSGAGSICTECKLIDPDWSSCAVQECSSSCKDPYELNFMNTDCIYPCQKNNANPKWKENNDDSLQYYFQAQKINGSDKVFCFRQMPTIKDMPGANEALCEPKGGYCQINNNGLEDITNLNYTVDNACWTFDSEQDCYRPINDNFNIITTNNDPDVPVFVYPNNTKWTTSNPPAEGMPAQCWALSPAGYSYSTNVTSSLQPSHPNPYPIAANFCKQPIPQ